MRRVCCLIVGAVLIGCSGQSASYDLYIHDDLDEQWSVLKNALIEIDSKIYGGASIDDIKKAWQSMSPELDSMDRKVSEMWVAFDSATRNP